MKKSMLLIAISLLWQLSSAQSGEFEIQKNGLIYSESTMNNLKTIVDSLNLKFKTCAIDKVFHSKYQTVGHRVTISKNRVKEARKDIENNISFEEFVKKYPNAEVTKHRLIVKFDYKDRKNKDIIEFSEISLNEDYGDEIRFKENLQKYDPDKLSKWIFNYYKKRTYSDESLTAFYLPTTFESKELPQHYAQMISYSDCLIDTTATKFREGLESGHGELPKNWKRQSKDRQEKLLETLRSTRVVGLCSMDDRPRRHAVNIAMLSAETQNWQVFLRAHLDVMNDRFERASDGSYAWGRRKTYIRELEELNINVLDLILGISLRVEDPALNHYQGSIRRIGRALSETQNKNEVESELLALPKDKELDLYNRILAFYILDNYIYNLTDESEKQKLNMQLKDAINSLPQELKEQIKIG